MTFERLNAYLKQETKRKNVTDTNLVFAIFFLLLATLLDTDLHKILSENINGVLFLKLLTH